MARPTTSANRPPISQPTTTENAPPAENATGKAVMPPARMQMIENEIAKFENPPMRAGELLGVAHVMEDLHVLVDDPTVVAGTHPSSSAVWLTCSLAASRTRRARTAPGAAAVPAASGVPPGHATDRSARIRPRASPFRAGSCSSLERDQQPPLGQRCAVAGARSACPSAVTTQLARDRRARRAAAAAPRPPGPAAGRAAAARPA